MTRIFPTRRPAAEPVPSGGEQRRDRGFTLVELLVVVSILGVLTTVSAVSVRGLSSNAQAGACEADVRTLELAVESALANDLSTDEIPTAYEAQTGLTAEGYLVAAGYLRDESAIHDVSSSGAITPTADGECDVTP